jgi:hypothetical protein
VHQATLPAVSVNGRKETSCSAADPVCVDAVGRIASTFADGGQRAHTGGGDGVGVERVEADRHVLVGVRVLRRAYSSDGSS